METLVVFVYKKLKKGSYPTYEEWKLLSPPIASLASLCSYPTYEEWKLLTVLFLLSTLL